MEQFEKWYGELPMREDAEDFTLATQAKYKKGWRAAFECMKQKMLDNADSETLTFSDIEKELEES